LKVSSPWNEGFVGTFVRGASAPQLSALVNRAAQADPDCVRMVLFVRNDPMYREELEKSAGATLNTMPAEGYLEYFSVHAPENPTHVPVAAVGVLMMSSKASCAPK
jgi:hypothetical protein